MRDQDGNKWVKVKDYSNGSLRSKIAQATTLEELESYRDLVLELAGRGELSGSNLRKLEKAGAARYKHLSTQLVRPVAPTLLIPKHLAGGKLIVEPKHEHGLER